MWEQYRKNAIITQLFIVTICAVMFLFGKASFIAVLIPFVVMQFAAVLGAAWAVRLKRKIATAKETRLRPL